MSGVFVTEAPSSEPPPLAAAPEPTWMQQAGAAFRTAMDDDEAGNFGNKIAAYNALEDELVRLGNKRERYNRPEWRSFLTTPETSPQRMDALWRDVEAARARDPRYFADVPKTRAEFDRWAFSRRGERAKDLETLDRGDSLTAKFGPQLGLGLLQAGSPENLPYMVIGGGSPTVAGLMAREFLTNAQGEVVRTPITARARANMGETYDSAGTDVLVAGTAGSLLAGGIHVGGKAVVGAVDRLTPLDRKIARAIDQAPIAMLPDSEVVQRFGDAVPAEIRTPDQIAALHVIDRQADVDAANPYVRTPASMDAHATNLQAMIEALLAVRSGKPDAPAIADVVRGSAPIDRAALKASIARFESGGSYGARNPQPGQTAAGKYQFIDDSWKRFGRLAFPGSSDAEIMAIRGDPTAQERVMDATLDEYLRAYRAAGIDPAPGDIYLMHAVGPRAVDIVRAAGDTPIARLVSRKAMDANPTWLRGTAADVRAEFARRTGSEAGPVERIADGGQTGLDADLTAARAGIDVERPQIDPPVMVRDDVLASAYRLPDSAPARAIASDLPEIAPRTAVTLGQARDAAAGFIGTPLRNVETGLEATVSRTTLGKMTSASAANKSTSAVDHAMAVANADRLFAAATLVERGPDARGEPTIAAISRYHAPMETPDGPVTVRMTVKETASPKMPNPLYTIETMEVGPRGPAGGDGVEPGRKAPTDAETSAGIERAPGQNRNAPRPGSATDIAPIARNVDGARGAGGEGGEQFDLAFDSPALEAFGDPTGGGAKLVADSMTHDLRAAIEAGETGSFRLGDGDERPIADILAEIDADEAAIAAARACL